MTGLRRRRRGMKWRVAAIVGLMSVMGYGSAQRSAVSFDRPSGPAVLEVEYQVRCTGSSSAGLILFREGDQTVRLSLPEGKNRVRAFVHRIPENISESLHLQERPGCAVQVLGASVMAPSATAEDQRVQDHAPMIVVRPDQLEKVDNDVPLLTAYEWFPKENGNRALRYTVFFSDEDSLPKAADVRSQQDLYGRRSDIEWVYEVEFDAQGSVVARHYQGGLLFGVGHTTRQFRGRFLPGTQHPILFNAADHNVFSDKAPLGWDSRVLYAGVPEVELRPDTPREAVMAEAPWLFWQNDRELEREGRSVSESDRYIYLIERGSVPRFQAVPIGHQRRKPATVSESFRLVRSDRTYRVQWLN